MKPTLTFLTALLLAYPPAATQAATSGNCDVCIYGGTSGGVVAAVQAARMGKSVVLLEPGRHLGGMTSGGLSAVDIGDPRSVGGIAREIFSRIAASHVAFASVRMEPVFMGSSQSAATAAALAIDAGVPVQAVDYDPLRARLLADGQILDWTPR